MDSNPLEWKAPIMGFLLWVSWVVMSYHNQRKVTETNQSQFLYKSSRCFYTLKYPSHSFCPNIDFSWPTWIPKTCFHLLTHSPPTQAFRVLPHSGLFSFSLMLMALSALHQVLKGLCHRMCPASSSLLSILMLFPVSTTLGVYSDVCQLCISPVPPVDTSSEGPSKMTTPLHLQKVFLRNKWPGSLQHTINCITRFSHLL